MNTALATFVATAVSAFVCVNNGRNKMDDLFYANAEALARQEIGFGEMCSKTGTLGDHYMPLCSACNEKKRYYAMDVVAFCK